MVAALAAAAALLGAACSPAGGGNYPYPMPGDAGATGGGGGGPPPPPSGTVAVEIHAPAAGALLSTNAAADVSAKVTVTNGTDYVDPNSVTVTLAPAGGGSTDSAGNLIGPTGDSEYSGKLSLAGLQAGDYTLTVSATSSSGVFGKAQVAIKLDAGPQITVISPTPGRHYKSSLVVQIFADPGGYPPLSNLQGSIGDVALDLQPAGSADQYRATINFDDQMPPLTGQQLLDVSAEDANGTRTDIRLVFVVDDLGPTITSTAPAPGDVVGGVIKISATVADDAGLNASSIIVLIGDEINPEFQLPLASEGNGVYSVLFDTAKLTQCKLPPDPGLCIIYPTLSFRAADLLGNETTVSYEIAVDNMPPIADLNPPNLRDIKNDEGWRCSFEFDPLGVDTSSGDMPDDNCAVPQVFDLRARLEDDGNRATGLKVVPIAGVDPDNANVYVLDDTTQALVVDTDGDGNCDSINPLLIPVTNPPTRPDEVLKVRLAPVPPAGHADFEPDPSLIPSPICDRGRDTGPPDLLCSFAQPTIAISYAHGQSAIWSVEPIDKLYCLGSQFDTLANNISEGWACIAVGAKDKNGNGGVSAPLRVYIQYAGTAGFCAAPPASAGPPPPCTGIYDRASNTVSAGACQTRKFSTGYCLLGDCD
jgi:hypothetical protein